MQLSYVCLTVLAPPTATITFRIYPEHSDMLEALIAAEPLPRATRSDVLRRLIAEAHEQLGEGKAKPSASSLKPKQPVDPKRAEVVGRIAAMWAESVAPHIPRIHHKSRHREERIMSLWDETPDFEAWRWAMKAFGRSEWHMNPENTVKITFSTMTKTSGGITWAEWLGIGERLKAAEEAPQSTIEPEPESELIRAARALRDAPGAPQ